MSTEETTNKKTLTGIVVSTKMQDTAVVQVDQYVKHPRYLKYIKKSKKYSAHDPGNEYAEGDKVIIEETRPISKTKHFKVVGNVEE